MDVHPSEMELGSTSEIAKTHEQCIGEEIGYEAEQTYKERSKYVEQIFGKGKLECVKECNHTSASFVAQKLTSRNLQCSQDSLFISSRADAERRYPDRISTNFNSTNRCITCIAQSKPTKSVSGSTISLNFNPGVIKSSEAVFSDSEKTHLALHQSATLSSSHSTEFSHIITFKTRMPDAEKFRHLNFIGDSKLPSLLAISPGLVTPMLGELREGINNVNISKRNHQCRNLNIELPLVRQPYIADNISTVSENVTNKPSTECTSSKCWKEFNLFSKYISLDQEYPQILLITEPILTFQELIQQEAAAEYGTNELKNLQIQNDRVKNVHQPIPMFVKGNDILLKKYLDQKLKGKGLDRKSHNLMASGEDGCSGQLEDSSQYFAVNSLRTWNPALYQPNDNYIKMRDLTKEMRKGLSIEIFNKYHDILKAYLCGYLTISDCDRQAMELLPGNMHDLHSQLFLLLTSTCFIEDVKPLKRATQDYDSRKKISQYLPDISTINARIVHHSLLMDWTTPDKNAGELINASLRTILKDRIEAAIRIKKTHGISDIGFLKYFGQKRKPNIPHELATIQASCPTIITTRDILDSLEMPEHMGFTSTKTLLEFRSHKKLHLKMREHVNLLRLKGNKGKETTSLSGCRSKFNDLMTDATGTM